MVKIFEESDRVTVVFPKVDNAQEMIEKILKDVYGEAEEVKRVEVPGLIPDKTPPKANGVQVITKAPKKMHKRTDAILKDARNPFKGKLPYDVFQEIGIKALTSYRDMHLTRSEYDSQISREMFVDLKRYLKEINTTEYMTTTPLENIKSIITVLSTTVNKTPMDSILNALAINDIDTFLKEGSESQIRSAAVKVVTDTLKLLR